MSWVYMYIGRGTRDGSVLIKGHLCTNMYPNIHVIIANMFHEAEKDRDVGNLWRGRAKVAIQFAGSFLVRCGLFVLA